MDKHINLLVFGGKWQLDNIQEDSYNEGIWIMLLTAVVNIFQTCSHFDGSFLKDSFIDSSHEKLKLFPKEQQNIFLSKEFKRMVLEIKCPSEYILDLFVSELMLEDNCVEKVQYRSRKYMFMTYHTECCRGRNVRRNDSLPN